ncbi:MAG: tyrosine-type recombinase/integrase [Fluviibacter sp.]
MPTQLNFTKEGLEALKSKANRYTVYDNVVPKLALRVSPAGLKTFNVIKWVDGRAVWVKLGVFPEMTTAQARKEAQMTLGTLASGRDPMALRRANRAANKAGIVKAMDAWQVYIKARSRSWSDSHKADHTKVSAAGGKLRTRGRRPSESDRTQEGILVPLLKLPLKRIDSNHVASWLKTESKNRPTHARLAFTIFRAFLSWCSEQPDYKDLTDPTACSTKAVRSILPKKKAKTDCLQREQLAAWFSEVQKLSSPTVRAYLQILLLIGARRGELSALRWENVDLKWCSLTLRDKVDGERTIPMTPYVQTLLLQLKSLRDTPPPAYRILNGKRIKNDLKGWKPTPWVFSSNTAKSGYLQDPSGALLRACTAAGVPGVTLHGLRRSFKSLSEWVEVPTGVVAQIMGHKPSATAEKHYTVRPLDLLRMWHTRIETWVLEQAEISEPKGSPKNAGLKKVKL